MSLSPKQLLNSMFEAAVAAALPDVCIPPHLPPLPKGRLVVVGAGKAAASMARAVEHHYQGKVEGLVVTRYGHGVPCDHIEVVEASHPVPDAAGRDAARRILEKVKGLGPDDLVLCLISGGGSALLALPAEGITLEDKQAINRALLRSGANIAEMNCVRKHLSAVKGGRLAAAAAPARMLTLMISDVPGDDPSVIASGPTVPDPTTCAEALAILAKYSIEVPAGITEALKANKLETPKPGDAIFANTSTIMVATPQMAIMAAAKVASEAGVTPVVLGDSIEGESREVAMVHAGIARQVANHRQPAPPPAVLISGGETTVTIKGKGGRGGRNSEFLLALAVALDGAKGIYAIACDTDGIDGSEDNAGAIVTPDTLARAAAKGVKGKEKLAENDAYSFFEAIGDLVVPGPTLTNVNDFRVIYIEG